MELRHILPDVPLFNRYFDPFVGGGSVFMAMDAEEYFINDVSGELMELYGCIAATDRDFFRYAEEMDKSWRRAALFAEANPALAEMYKRHRAGLVGKEELRAFLRAFCADERVPILRIPGGTFGTFPCPLPEEMEASLLRKMERMRKIEANRHELSDADLYANIETAVKSALYASYRHLYNRKGIRESDRKLHCALFFFVRNYAYGGMFRYSGEGDFNVPYGGIAYNGKSMVKKLGYYRSRPVLDRFTRTRIHNLDFEEFLRSAKPSEDDFVFLDPPYDSEFSTYARNAFTREDHRRLAGFMLNECKAKWMMIIKDTDFISGLYDKKGIGIRAFDKEYLVNFMNRNDRKVTHLLITNY